MGLHGSASTAKIISNMLCAVHTVVTGEALMLAKKAGATDDEIKAAIQIAAEVSRFSILLYGNEFGQDNLKKILKKMTSK